ncbi:hypothetical protein Thimo_2901 [Thioflavicoccus mobilis 8321]|uniref:Cation transport ATPase n=1 Tax=Thioflavicoccus mobilis 8321 TaxID=765912 RepID=L0H0L2_9GAMM|nr:hypothetical protein Thimo_2901 [Thioflavicoccus mobilis 8321]
MPTESEPMYEICHRIPGRLRLRIPALRDNPALARRLTARLRGHAAVADARANPACASLILHLKPGRSDEVAALSSIAAALSEMPVSAPPAPRARQMRAPRRSSGRRQARPARTVPPSAISRLQERLARWMLRGSVEVWRHDLLHPRRGLHDERRCAATTTARGRSTREPLGERLRRWLKLTEFRVLFGRPQDV